MRDVVAGLVAIALLVAAASLATTLTAYRRRRERAREAQRLAGRTIVAEIPTADELVIVSEDAHHFYYGRRPIDKASIVAVRLLINGATLSAHARGSERPVDQSPPLTFNADPSASEGMTRDRWDVAIETSGDTILIECGAIREGVSQELARAVFDAVKRDLEERDDFKFQV